MPYHVALDRANEARLGGREGRDHGARDRSGLRRPGLAPGPADGGPARPRRPARADRPGRCPTRTWCWPAMGARRLRGRAARRTGARLGRSPARPPRRHDLAGPGRAGPRRARPARGRPGHAARPRPRQLPVRDLVEPGRRRRVHGRRDRAAPGRRGHRRDEGLLDAGRLGAVPDRAARRDRGRDRRARPRVRDRDRSAAPGRLVRRRAAALCGRRQQRQLDHAQQARHPVRHRHRSGCASPTRSTADAWRPGRPAARRSPRATPIYEDFEGWAEPIHDVRSLADLPENARRYVSAIEEHAGVPIVLVSVGPERTQTIERAWRPMRHRPAICRRERLVMPTRILIVGAAGASMRWPGSWPPSRASTRSSSRPAATRSRPSRASGACPASTRSMARRSWRSPGREPSSWS